MAEDLQQIYGQALEAHQAGDVERAVELYGRILAQFPDADLVLYNQGLALYDLDHFAKAATAFAKAAEIRNDDADTWFNLGLALKQDRRYAEAIRAYERALQLQPDNGKLLYNLACCYKDSGDHEQAIVFYKKTLESNPDDTAALNNLAYLKHRQGEFAEAKKYYQQLLDIKPNHPSANYMLAALGGQAVDTPPQEYVRDLFDQYSDNFESSLIGKLGYQTPQLLKSRFDALEQKKAIYDKCLDLGCGTGLAGVAFRSVCKELTGVDLSEKMVEQAQEKQIYDRLEVGDILAFFDQHEGIFDLITAADVLTYLGDLFPLMQAVANNSDSGALFCFSTEKKMEPGWKLQTTGRFAHHIDYVLETASKAGWQLLFTETVDLRREGDAWIRGDIYIMT